MKEKYHELADETITYILEPAFVRPHEPPKFEIAGFLLAGQTTVFTLDANLKAYKGATVEPAKTFVSERLLSEMDRQMNEYAGSNPDILADIMQDRPDQLTTLLYTAGQEKPFCPKFMLQWACLDEGMVRIALQQQTIQFDLKTQRFGMEDGAPLNCPLYELLNPVGYWQQIAEKQRELGIQNAGYAELAKINGFLVGRSSARILLRDNREFTVKADDGISAGDLFNRNYHSKMLELGDSCAVFPRHNDHIPIEEVVCLMHGKKYLDVDVTAIRELFGERAPQEHLEPGQAGPGLEM